MRAQDPKFSNNTLFWVKLEIFIDSNHKLVKLKNELLFMIQQLFLQI